MAGSIDDILQGIVPDPTKDPAADPEKDLNTEEVTDPENDKELTPEEVKKQNAAYAKMRVENRTLKTQVDSLTKQLAEISKAQKNPDNTEQDEKDLKKDQTDLERRLAEIEEKLKQTTSDLEAEKTEKRKQVAITNLTSLRDEYNLTPDDLVQFAEDAEARGINLAEDPYRIRDHYRMLYMDKIVEAEVTKKLKEQGLLGDGASLGPKGGGKGPNKGASFDDILKQIK